MNWLDSDRHLLVDLWPAYGLALASAALFWAARRLNAWTPTDALPGSPDPFLGVFEGPDER